jgi:hypothetical protein
MVCVDLTVLVETADAAEISSLCSGAREVNERKPIPTSRRMARVTYKISLILIFCLSMTRSFYWCFDWERREDAQTASSPVSPQLA